MLGIVNNKWLLWLVLAIPAMPLLMDFIHDERYYAEIMHKSGVWAAKLMAISMMITPLRMLTNRLPGRLYTMPIIKWLMRRRRNFGVAAFAYAYIHVLFYFRNVADFEAILLESTDLDLFVGWLAFILFSLLAMTSNNYSVSRLGKKWYSLHRWVYPCAVLTFLHWLWFDFYYDKIFLIFVPLALLQLNRIYLNYQQKPNS